MDRPIKRRTTNRLPLLGREVEAFISISLLCFCSGLKFFVVLLLLHLHLFAVGLKFGLKEHEIPQQQQAGNRWLQANFKTMTRTDLQKAYIKRIDALNDQLWYFVFASEELNAQLENYTDKAKEVFTTDLFKNNPYSKKIHVKAINLTKHQEENKKLTFGSYLSTCYEIASDYEKDLFEKIKVTNGLAHYTWNDLAEPEKNLKKLFNQNGVVLPPAYIFDTFTYLRLRRNHFIHLILAPNNKLSTFIGDTGNSLNEQWKDTGVVKAIDFTSLANVAEFTQDQTIDLIKLLRICLIELDEYIASLLNVNDTIKQLVEKEYGDKKVRLNSDIRKERSKRIVSIAKSRLNLTVSDAEVEPHVKTIGAK